MKTCSKCKIEKNYSDFHKSSIKKNRDGYRSWCKSCIKIDNSLRESRYKGTRKKYREEHKTDLAENKRIYYLNNREKVLKTNSNYRTSLNYRYISYKNNAKHRNIDWSLTKEEFEILWNKDCHYCGAEIATIGIDRVDSKIGYITSNIVPCCSICNTIKLDFTYTEFTQQIIKIYNFLKLWEHTEKLKVI